MKQNFGSNGHEPDLLHKGVHYPDVVPPEQSHYHIGGLDAHHEPDLNHQPPGTVLVAAPKLEPQPWALNVWRWLGSNTTGIARVDLRRPLPPPVESYGNNLLLPTRRGRGRGRPLKDERGVQAYHQNYQDEVFPSTDNSYRTFGPSATRLFTGARLKITRHMTWLKPPDAQGTFGCVPWFDVGLGMNLELDRQKLLGVARLKIKDLVAVKLLPSPSIKVAKTWRVPRLNMALKLWYECPMADVLHFYRPPARLMLRVDSNVGSGLHVSPLGVEFDERVITLGKNVSVRLAGGLVFPRQLPISPEDRDAFAIKFHRLSVKAPW